MNNRIGTVIRSYELEGLVGTGGFGAVYRARQSSVAREVAIKIIWPAFANHPNFIRRFEAEAQLVAGLEHPYIVPVYDYWRDADGAYIVMRYLRGGHLQENLDGKGLPLKDVLHICDNITAALALAHRFGVVHRDIKPANILLDEEGNAYLADFGIAQILSAAKDEDDEMSGMGSPAYAAPEQMQGGITSAQTDIYSLGVVLFELLTGEHPFPELEELSMTQLLRVRTTQPLPPLISRRTDLPPALNDVIQRATSLDPKQRYPDALSLSYAMREASGQGISMSVSSGKRTETELLPNPYRGLRAFHENDASVFYGRESLVRRLLNRLWENETFGRFLAVVGPSGSGKSSVVRAGLIPALRQGALPGSQEWFYAEFVPGTQPLQELVNVIKGVSAKPVADDLAAQITQDETVFSTALNAALPTENSEMMILIDQFEEVFTLNTDDRLAMSFINALYYAVSNPDSRVRLIVTIRADFYDRPLLTPRISDLVRERTEVVVPLSVSELERVIVEPARSVGVAIDNALVASIMAEVQEQPGALPLLQYALTELFDNRDGMLITQAAYKAIGGVRGALARRADDIYAHFDTEHQEVIRQLFLRLITLGEGTEDTRRRALLAEVTTLNARGDAAMMQVVVDTLGQARLLTFDRDPITRSPTVEVTHEAIIREWGKLREWLEDSRGDVRLQRALSSLAQEWEQSVRDPSYLLRGIRLQQYERWLKSSNLALTQGENFYLQASINARQQLDTEEQQRLARERRLERRNINFLRLIIAGLIVLVVGAIGLTGFALSESQRAEASARVAQENAEISRSIAFASSAQNAQTNGDGDLALVLALAANTLPTPPVDAMATLNDVALARGTQRRFTGNTANVTGVAISTDNLRIASSSTDATVRVWDATTGETLHVLNGHTGDVQNVAFDNTTTRLVSASVDFTAMIWDLNTGTAMQVLRGHTAPVTQALFTPDGKYVLTASNDSTVRLWDSVTGELVRTFSEHLASVIALDVAGAVVVSGSRDGAILVWDYTTGSILKSFALQSATFTDLDLSQDGLSVVVAYDDAPMALWDVETGEIVRQFVGTETFGIRSVVFTQRSQYVLTGNLDGVVQLWDVATGLLLQRMLGHTDAVSGLATSETRPLAVSGSQDRTVRLWNIGNPGEVASDTIHSARISDLLVGSQTGAIYTGSADTTLVLSSPTERSVQVFPYTDMAIAALAISDDEKTALLGTREGMIQVVNLETGFIESTLVGHTAAVQHIAFLPNGRAMSSSQATELILWDLATSREIRRYAVDVEGAINSFAILNDGARVVASMDDNSLHIYDVASGALLQTLTGHTGAVYSVVTNADSTLIASGARDGYVLLWDAATGAEAARFTTDGNAVWALAFNARGDKLASAGAAGDVRVWDIASGTSLQRFTTTGTIYALAFSAADDRLYSGLDDGTLIEWRVFNNTDAQAWAATNRYERDLDCFERARYRVEPACAAT